MNVLLFLVFLIFFVLYAFWLGKFRNNKCYLILLVNLCPYQLPIYDTFQVFNWCRLLYSTGNIKFKLVISSITTLVYICPNICIHTPLSDYILHVEFRKNWNVGTSSIQFDFQTQNFLPYSKPEIIQYWIIGNIKKSQISRLLTILSQNPK